jgi:hypothetical protein
VKQSRLSTELSRVPIQMHVFNMKTRMWYFHKRFKEISPNWILRRWQTNGKCFWLLMCLYTNNGISYCALVMYSDYKIWFSLISFTEFSDTQRYSRVVKTPVSYSEGSGFRSRPGGRVYWLRFSWFSSAFPDECPHSTLKLIHDRFLPNSFQFIIHLSSFHSTL